MKNLLKKVLPILIMLLPMSLPTRAEMTFAPIDSLSLPARYSLSDIDTTHHIAGANPLTPPDTDAARSLLPADSMHIAAKRHEWLDLLKGRRLNVKDTSVHYPRFIDFCIRTYRWIDHTFNYFDPEYVRGIGKLGKVKIVSEDWTDAYYLRSANGLPLSMVSSPYYNLGFNLSYSILSFGHSWDMQTVFHGNKSYHSKSSLAITCARFFAEGYYWQNNGVTNLRRIGDQKLRNLKGEEFEGIEFGAVNVDAFYIFNNSKFSLGAAYNMSHRQLKSQGSWLGGISLSGYVCNFDFSKLPPSVLVQTELPQTQYSFKYNCIAALGGYSYNLVLGRNWLFNITAIPGIGISQSLEDTTAGAQYLPAFNAKGKFSVRYLERNFFFQMNGAAYANFFLLPSVKYISTMLTFQLATGILF